MRNRLIYLIFLLLINCLPKSDIGETTFGGSGWDAGYSVQETSDGGYIIAGYTWSYASGGLDVRDVYLVKTDMNGNLLWQTTFGGSGEDWGWSVRETSDGGYIIAGSTESFAGGLYLIKTDANGDLLWQKTFDGDGARSVQETSDGGYIITGIRWSNVCLVKTDGNGNLLWQTTFGGSGEEWGWSVRETSDGGYIIAGSTESFGAGERDVYLIKTDRNGNLLWQTTFGGSGWDIARSVQETSDGGYIIVGDCRSFGAGLSDVYLIKTDGSGNLVWQKTFGGSDFDNGFSVQETSDGGYIIVGESWSFGAGLSDVYLIKTDASGNQQWFKTFGGSFSDEGHSVQQTSDGGYIIAGSTFSFGAGGEDVYLIKTDGQGNREK